MNGINQLKLLAKDLVDIIFPNVCTVCHKSLVRGEKYICLDCLMSLPRTDFHLSNPNPLHDRLFSRNIPIEKATSLFHYYKGNKFASIIHDTKYRGRPNVGRYFACKHATELLPTGFFNNIDLIVPVPLHIIRKLHRGYNQAEKIAHGLSEATGIPVINPLVASFHKSQTKKNAHARLMNAMNVYKVMDANMLSGKHILLVDDVITTGSTMIACLNAIKNAVPDVVLSIYSLAATKLE